MDIFTLDSECPKCGYDISPPETRWAHTNELLIRICRRCSYSWDELPLDFIASKLNSEALKRIKDHEQ